MNTTTEQNNTFIHVNYTSYIRGTFALYVCFWIKSKSVEINVINLVVRFITNNLKDAQLTWNSGIIYKTKLLLEHHKVKQNRRSSCGGGGISSTFGKTGISTTLAKPEDLRHVNWIKFKNRKSFDRYLKKLKTGIPSTIRKTRISTTHKKTGISTHLLIVLIIANCQLIYFTAIKCSSFYQIRL